MHLPSVLPSDDMVQLMRNTVSAFAHIFCERVWSEQVVGLVKMALGVIVPQPLVLLNVTSTATFEALPPMQMLAALINYDDLPSLVESSFF